MGAYKTRTMAGIEQKMEDMDESSFRYHVLSTAKNFKTSWVELGRSLYAVWKDKMFKEWGFISFDAYTAKEIGIRKQTALKLLRSYYFLEKEEPAHLVSAPAYESVDLLRLAKNKKELDAQDYDHLKKEVFDKGRDAREIKKDLSALIRQRQELDPQEAWEKKRMATVKRFLGALKGLKQEIESAKLLPASVIKDAEALIKKLEEEIA
ncbi:MAG TPA: hypothetical protein VMD52_08280 [Patescibacteria group bacterium]|nr:hypothetical protein [Patescibacteria group bacterium]